MDLFHTGTLPWAVTFTEVRLFPISTISPVHMWSQRFPQFALDLFALDSLWGFLCFNSSVVSFQWKFRAFRAKFPPNPLFYPPSLVKFTQSPTQPLSSPSFYKWDPGQDPTFKKNPYSYCIIMVNWNIEINSCTHQIPVHSFHIGGLYECPIKCDPRCTPSIPTKG